MAVITLNIPDDLARFLSEHEQDLRHVLEPALRPKDPIIAGCEEALRRLAAAKSNEEILALRPDSVFTDRVWELVEKSRSTGLSESEQKQWDLYELLERFVGLAKARALAELNQK